MDWAQHCDLFSLLFSAAMVCALAGNALGMMAWEHRTDEQPEWKWLLDPMYAFRPSYYRTPALSSRYAAMVFLSSGGVFLWLLVLAVIDATRSGAGRFCGLAF